MRRGWRKASDRRGFTFAELLVVLAIVVALVAIGIAGAAEIQRNMKQTRLDRMAENLYSAAQNQLKLRAASGVALMGTELSTAPADMTAKEQNYCYPTDTQAPAHHLRYFLSPDATLFPAGSISSELQSGKWIVELEPKSYTVYSVFYFDPEDESAAAVAELIGNYTNYNTNGGAFGDTLRELRGEPKERRKASGGVAGYFSGSVADLAERKTGELKCSLELKNEEELKALVTVELPFDPLVWQDGDYVGETLTLMITVTGQASGAKKTVGLSHTLTALELSNKATNVPARHVKQVRLGAPGETDLLVADDRLLFDSLKDGKGFRSLFQADDEDPAKKFIPGEDIRVEAIVSCGNEEIVLYQAADAKTANSLFANGSGSGAVTIGENARTPVYVEYGRHLQNLSAASGFAGYAGKTVAAMQIAPLDFGNSSPWQTVYGEDAKFKPVNDPKIAGYYGNNYEIRYLNTGSVAGNAGVFAKFSGSDLNNIKLIHCTVAGSGSVGGLVGTASGELTVSDCKTQKCAVSGSAASAVGGLVGTSSAKLTMTACESDDSTVAGGSAAGGLVGAAGAAEIKNSRVLMSTQRCGTTETARDVNWVTASENGGAAGGLVGGASGALNIDKSFAATVVKGGNHAGGLVGSATGAMTVTNSYADCYLNASHVGGLAGYCADGSGFTNCYSAGFVMDGAGLRTVGYAAGFAPSKADVRNSYTVFCFDDATRLAEGTIDAPAPAAATMNVYALANGGARENAYHNCQLDAKDATGTYKTAEEMDALKASHLGGGFNYSDADTTLYHMMAAGIVPTEPYPYPSIPGLPHYNDFLATTPADPVELWAVLLKGAAGAPEIKAEPQPYGKSKLSGEYVPVKFVPRNVNKLVFVGWFDEETLFSGSGDARELKTNMLKGWYAQLDKLNISSGRLLNVPESFGALPYGDGRVDVKDSESVKETKRLYAVYREVLPFNVEIKFVNYDVSLFKGSGFTAQQIRAQYLEGSSPYQGTPFTVDPLQYDSFDRSGETAMTRTFTINIKKLRQNGYAIIDEDYALRDAYPEGYPAAEYPDLDMKYLRMKCFTFDGQNPIEETPTSAEYVKVDADTATLTIKINEKRICSILCSSAQFEVPLRFAFLDAEANTFDDAKNNAIRSADYPNKYPAYADFSEKMAELVKNRNYAAPTETTDAIPNGKDFWISDDGSYCLRKEGEKVVRHQVYTVVVNMKLPPNMVVWKQIPEFDDFELLKKEIQNQTILKTNLDENNVYPLEKAPLIPFARVYYELAFDLDGGVHFTAEDKYFNSMDPIRDMRRSEDTKLLLPTSLEGRNVAANAERVEKSGWLNRQGYFLTGWEFYDLKTYSADSKEPLGRIELWSPRDESGTENQHKDKYGTIKSVTLYEYKKDENGNTVMGEDGNPVVEKTETPDSYLMPARDVMAKAHWEKREKAPVRVEVYVQNVTDKWELNRGRIDEATYEQDATYRSNTDARSYGLYNAYMVGTKDAPVTIATYEGKTDPGGLLRLAYTGSENGSGKASGTRVEDQNALSDSDYRVYLSRSTGRVRNDQLIFNSAKTYGDGDDIPYEFDAFGNAVFRVYYDRALNTFQFESNSWLDRFPKQNGNDPGDYDGYEMKRVYLHKGKWYTRKTWVFWTIYTRTVHLLNDDRIDGVLAGDGFDESDYRLATSSDAGDEGAVGSPIIKINGNYYVFAKLVKRQNTILGMVGDSYYAPFYTADELALAQGYMWSLSPEGLYKKISEGLSETHYGLFEQPFTDWSWPGGGSFEWTVYTARRADESPLPLDSTKLSYLDSFYYDNWMKKASDNRLLRFEGDQKMDVERKVRFYLEKDGERSNPIEFREEPKYIWRTDSSGKFGLNEKFNGYKVYAYCADEDYDDGGFKVTGGAYPDVSYDEILDIYYARESYSVYFKDARFGSADETALTRYHGQTVDRLPDVSELNAPADIGQFGYVFGGWYTGSDGKGNKLVVCEKKNGVYVPVDKPETEPEDGVTWQKGDVCERVRNPDAAPGAADEYTYQPYRIFAANRMAFAYWAKQEATVKLFYLFPDKNDPTEADKTLKTSLFEKIAALDPMDADSIEQEWAATGKYDVATKTYAVSDSLKYHFDGWYIWRKDSVPTRSTALNTRFHEKELLAQDDLTLAAKWSQNAGAADYMIVCNLCDENGAIVKTLEISMSAAGSRCRVSGKEEPIPLAAVGSAAVGEPLNVYAPTATDYPELANELSGYYALTSIQSIERFQPGDSVIFYYMPAVCWYYKTTYWADFGGVRVAIYSDLNTKDGKPTRKSYAENVYVIANDPYQCYTLDASSTNPVQLLRPANFDSTTEDDRKNNPESAEFTYRFNGNGITSTNAINWVLGNTEKPKLVSIAGVEDDTLSCFTAGYFFETSYSCGSETNTDLTELLNNDLPLGTSTVKSTITLKGGGVEKQIYEGTTFVTVYREVELGSLGTFYDDGKAFYAKDGDAMTKTAYARVTFDGLGTTLYYDGEKFYSVDTMAETTLDGVKQAAENAGAGKTFLGFYKSLGDANAVIDKDGNVIGSVTGEVELKAKYE